ncbi:hypothetical protein WA026_001558 [Henosepilachna vigintioctopunctata]|uniref:Uncharacterized protein n=1 Tax=Henosepilachna vigintioctopunctata TaxID=420089 RepID=A0AAW1US72_9CUCU
MRLIGLVCFITIFVVSSVISVNNLREEFTWTRIDYDWENRRNTRDVQLEDRYGISSRQPPRRSQTQNDEAFYFPGSSQSHNYGGRPNNNYGGRPQNSGKRPTQNQGSSWQNFQDSQVQNQGGSGSSTGSQRRENYIYQNNIPMGANAWGDKLFITVPRRRHGVPSTLNYVSLSSPNKHNTPLIPYPNWEMNALPENYNSSGFSSASVSRSERDRFVSVYRVEADSCDRLWFVDTGRMEIPGNPIQVQQPKLVVMDLRTDTVLRQFTFPASDALPSSLFAHIVVDTDPSNCNEAYAYIPDVSGYGLVVYSWRDDRSWRVTHNYFYLEPTRGEFNIAGHRFQWNDGVFSTALGPVVNGRRHLYFHSMAGSHLYRVPTNILRNQTAATRSYHQQDFESIGDRGEGSQTSVSALDIPSQVLFLGLVNQNALACWNINSPLTDIDIVQRDDQKMIYPCDLKIYNNNIYLLTNTMPGFLYGQLNYDVTNFRIWVQNVNQAIQGTRCASGSGNGFSGGSSGNRRGGGGGGSYNPTYNRKNNKGSTNNRDWTNYDFF